MPAGRREWESRVAEKREVPMTWMLSAPLSMNGRLDKLMGVGGRGPEDGRGRDEGGDEGHTWSMSQSYGAKDGPDRKVTSCIV